MTIAPTRRIAATMDPPIAAAIARHGSSAAATRPLYAKGAGQKREGLGAEEEEEANDILCSRNAKGWS